MTKSVRMRVVVPTDNEASTAAVIAHLQEALISLGTVHLAPPAPNGEDQQVGLAGGVREDLAGPIKGPRVHWAAADVLQGAEPAAPPPSPARKSSSSTRKRAAA